MDKKVIIIIVVVLFFVLKKIRKIIGPLLLALISERGRIYLYFPSFKK